MAEYSANLTPIYRISKFLDRLVHGTDAPEPVFRIECYLAKLAGRDVEIPEPIYRIEFYLARLCGMDVEIPVPIYRAEFYLAKLCGEEVTPPEVIYRISHWLADWAETGGTGSYYTLTGSTPLTLPHSLAAAIKSLIRYGSLTQTPAPTPDAPVWPSINNGTVRMVRPSGLPVRYQMVEWLTVTSPSKRITITGFKTKSTQELECKWYRSAQINCYLYASDASSSLTTNTTAYLATTNGTWRFDGRAAGFSAPVETICTSIQNKDGVWINGSKVGSYGDAGDFVSTNDLYLLNGSGSADVRLYYLKVSESGNLVLDLVPVRDNVSGTYGVYDKVNGAYYTNAEATFEVGADVEDAPYVTIDGTPEVLSVGGRNLANPALVDGEGWYIVSGKIANSAAANRTIVFPCKPNTTYSWWHCDGVGGMRAFESDTATPTVGDTAAWAVGSPAYKAANVVTTYTTSATAKYLIIDYSRRDSSSTRTHDEQFADFMLVEGAVSEALPYEPYRAPQTATVPDLFAVGDYKDEADIISGVVTRRVGKVALTSDLPWFKVTGQTGLFGVPVADGKWAANQLAVSSHYAGTVATNASMPDNTIKATHASTLAPNRISIYVKDTTHGTSLDTFKAWLDAAGVIAIFPLVTPVTESITPQALRTVDGATVVDSSAGSVEVTAEYRASEEPSSASGLMMARPESEDGGAADGS